MGDLVKTVTLRILADAGDAQAKLDEVTAKADALGADTVRVNVKVDAPDLATLDAKLAATRAMLADKGLTEAGIRIRVDGAGAAIAQLTAVKKAADDLGGGGGGILSKLAGLLGGFGGGSIPLGPLGAVPVAAGPAAIPAIAGIAAAAAAALPVIDMLVSGLAAAGAGAVAFGALSRGALSSVTSAYAAISAAQSKYAAASLNLDTAISKSPADMAAYHAVLKGLEPDLAQAAVLLTNQAITWQSLTPAQQASEVALRNNAAAYKTLLPSQQAALNVLIQQGDAWRAISPAEQQVVTSLQKLMGVGGAIAQAFQPTAFKIFNDALKVATDLLPAAVPLASAFANALHPLLQQLDKFAQSQGFKTWISQFTALIGPAVTAIGTGIGQILIQVGKLFTIFSGKDISRAITVVFDIIKVAIQGVVAAIEWLRTEWDKLSQNSTFQRLAGEFKTAWDDITKTGQKKPDFSGMTKALGDLLNTVDTYLMSKLPALIQTALHTAGQWLTANAQTILVPAGKALIEGLIQGIESSLPSLLGELGKIALFIAEHKGPLDYDRQLLVPHGQAIMQGLMTGMGSQMPALQAQLAGVTGMIATRGGGYGGGNVYITQQFHGVTTDQNTVRQLVQAVLEYKRHGGGAALGIA